MALIAPPDRVLETSTTTGTGTYTLAGAMAGFRAASAACANGDTAYYYAEDVDVNGVPTGGYEIGIGTWATGNTFARTTIHTSSNANAAVSWAAGTRRISLSLTAAKVSAMAASTLPLAITKTGNWKNQPVLTVLPSCNMDVGGVIVNGDGKWVNAFNYNENSVASGITALTYDDLVGIFGDQEFSSLANCATLSFPQLKFCSTFSMTTMSALTSLSFASLVSLSSTITNPNSLFISSAALTTLTLGTTLKCVSGNVSMTSCALTQASVDSVLARLAALDGTAGTVPFVNPRTVNITGTSATPSAAGLASKATLVARGVTVTHNP